MNSNEARISEGACRIWEAAGRPEGRDLEFWYQAEQRIRADTERKPSVIREILSRNLTMPWRNRLKS